MKIQSLLGSIKETKKSKKKQKKIKKLKKEMVDFQNNLEFNKEDDELLFEILPSEIANKAENCQNELNIFEDTEG